MDTLLTEPEYDNDTLIDSGVMLGKVLAFEYLVFMEEHDAAGALARWFEEKYTDTTLSYDDYEDRAVLTLEGQRYFMDERSYE